MKKMTIKINNITRVFLQTFFVIAFFVIPFWGMVSANNYQVACPFSSASNRTIVYFNTEFVWGKTAVEVTKSVNLSAGNYKVSLQSFDGYSGRNKISQPNESYFVEFRNGSGVVATSARTPDLQDNVTNASYAGTVNSNLNLSQAVTSVKARHANFLQNMGGANSVTTGCAAFDLISTPTPPAPTPDPTLSASCSVNPTSVNIGGYLNWTSSASGGTGSYAYSWSGTDGLTSNSSAVSKAYSSAGTKIGTVTITSGTQSVTRTCQSVVNTPPVENLTASCSVNPTSVNIGGYLNWTSSASGGTGS
jgi:hypothetical protein